MFCPDCGAAVQDGRKFCGKCGAPLGADAVEIAPVPSVPPPTPVAPPVPPRPVSTRSKLVYAMVALLVVLGGVAWWWFHRPAPPYKVQDPGIYPFQGLSADGKTVKVGFIDADGKVVVQPQWDGYALEWINGQLVAFNEGFCGVLKDGKWGFIDTGGHLTVPTQFDFAGSFVEGLARVKLGNQIGYIDKTGHYAINPQFDAAGDFHGGLAPVQSDGGWGFINKAGTFAVKPRFQAADTDGFSNGLAWVRSAGKLGYIDRSGALVIAPQFEGASTFSEGLAGVAIHGKWGYINRSGKIVINPQFDKVTMFSGGLAAVSVSGRQGTIDKQGKYVVNPGQYTIEVRDGDLQVASSSDGVGLLSRDGKWVVKPTKVLSGGVGVFGKVFYGIIGGQPVPISLSGKVLAGWYKGSMLDSLGQDFQNETSALQSMRSLVAGEFSYSNTFPGGFTGSLEKLGPAVGAPDAQHAGLIDAALAKGTKDGYQFVLNVPAGSATNGGNQGYTVVAKPLAGHAGRTFCIDPSDGLRPGSAIHYSTQGEECTGASPVAVGF